MSSFHVPQDVEVRRIALCKDGKSVTIQQAPQGATLSQCALVDALPEGHEVALVEYFSKERGKWHRHSHYHRSLAHDFPLQFKHAGRKWYVVCGSINGATRGEVIATTDAKLMDRLVPGWRQLDGLSRMKCGSRLLQPSIAGAPFELRMLVVDHPEHDGDGWLSPEATRRLASSFDVRSRLFKLTGPDLKAVLHQRHHRWDILPENVEARGESLTHNGTPIDGVIYASNFKLSKPKHGSVVTLTEEDLRLHSTEDRNSYHRAGLGRQVLQYADPQLGADLLASSDIPVNAALWTKAIGGNVDAVKAILRLDEDSGSDDHECRDQLTRHLAAGAMDLSVPYLRQKMLPLLEGFFSNHVRKGKASGAMLFTAPSDCLKSNEIVVPSRMLTPDERDILSAGGQLEMLAARYPVTSPSSINRVRIVGQHRGPVCYVANALWRDSFQGDHDGDQLALYRVDCSSWTNTTPWLPPKCGKPEPVSLAIALERAAESKRLVAIGETLLAEHHFRNCPSVDELNELGTRLVCGAVDMAKHGFPDWAFSPREFSIQFLSGDIGDRHPLLQLAAKSDGRHAEKSLNTRLAALKAVATDNPRNGWELLMSLVAGWIPESGLLPVGTNAELHCRLSATATPSCPRIRKAAEHARRRWASVCRDWLRSGNDQCLKIFAKRFEAWLERQDEDAQHQLFTEIGRVVLDPNRKGRASLWFRFVPSSLLTVQYG